LAHPVVLFNDWQMDDTADTPIGQWQLRMRQAEEGRDHQ